MIRIDRGPEPAALPQVRSSELQRVRQLHASGSFASKDVGEAYALVKDELWKQQAMRCCYCETWSQCSYNDVEHFRPKARADRGGGTVHGGYWWLAWTWENLLFSCPNCNRSGKNDAFPLEPGSVPLLADEQPPGGELPTLIDPCAEDPVELIRFAFDGNHWQPIGRQGSARGQRTVDILKLGRAELLTLYTAHVEESVKPKVDEVLEAIAQNDPARLAASWRRVRGLLSPRMPFVALSFDVIEHFLPKELRERWGLALPRPPVRGP